VPDKSEPLAKHDNKRGTFGLKKRVITLILIATLVITLGQGLEHLGLYNGGLVAAEKNCLNFWPC